MGNHHAAAVFAQPVAEDCGLSRLAGTLDPFKRDEQTIRHQLDLDAMRRSTTALLSTERSLT
jgi:hypothetical protein